MNLAPITSRPLDIQEHWELTYDQVWLTLEVWLKKNRKVINKVAGPLRKHLGATPNDLLHYGYVAGYEAIRIALARETLDQFYPIFCRRLRLNLIEAARGVPTVKASSLENISDPSILSPEEYVLENEEPADGHFPAYRHVLTTLTAPQRRVFLKLINGYTLQEIEQEEGTSRKQIIRRVSRAAQRVGKLKGKGHG